MGVDKRIKERMDEAVVKSYYKPWHKRWWGRALLVLAALFVVVLFYATWLVIDSVRHVNQGDIFHPESGTWISQEKYQDNQRTLADLMTDDDPWLGTENPIVNIVAYESFGCPFCAANQPDIKQMITKFGSIVRYTIKDFPTEGLHPNVFDSHLAAACAQEQGNYWQYHDKLYENQDEDGFTRAELKTFAGEVSLDVNQFSECMANEEYQQEIRQDYATGVQAGVVGTPTYVINGNLIPGAISYNVWEEIIAFILQGDY